MIYKKSNNVFGKFIDKKLLKNGMKAVILNETVSVPSTFTNPKTGEQQNQDLAKIKFEGLEGEYNVALNKPSLEAMIDAFGPDSVNWQGNPLTVEVEKTRVGGKAGISLFLIPEGYKKIDGKEGYAEIVKIGLEEQLNK